MATPVNSATMVGPLTKAYDSSVITTKSARPSNSAGPLTAGPSTIITTGTTPEQSAMALAASPQPWSAAMPSAMSAPLERTTATNGIRSLRAMVAAASIWSDDADDSAPCRVTASRSAHTTARPSRSRVSTCTVLGTCALIRTDDMCSA